MEKFETYLGDAVYAKVEDYGDVVLATSNGVEVTNRIVLEPSVLANFERWIKQTREEQP